MITSQDFNKKFFETAFNVAKHTFLPLLAVMVIVYAVMIALVAPVFVYKLGIDATFVQEYMSLGIFERNEYLEKFFENNLFNGFDPQNLDPTMIMSFVGLGIVFLLLILLFSSWYYNFIFVLVDDYIKNTVVNLKESFQSSFSKKVFTIFFLTILTIAIVVLLEVLFIGIVLGLASIHPALSVIGGFVGVILLVAVLMRFILVLPHIINEDVSAIESLSYSFNSVSFKAGLKYFAVIIVAYIVLMMVSVMLMSLKILGGIAGIIFLTILQVVFSGFTTALATSSNLGLYYLYNPGLLDGNPEREEADFEELELLED